MNRLVVCVGKKAKTPYRIAHIRKDIYCIEELCYYLCEYVSLLDRDIMDEKLAMWLMEECGLPEVSKRLLELIHFGGSVAAFTAMILEEAHYVDAERIRQIETLLKQNEELNVYERKKKRADALIAEKKYYYGLGIYHQLINEVPPSDAKLLAKVYYNCGVVYVRMFHYEIAKEMFGRAMKLTDDENIRKAYLFCQKCMLTAPKYTDEIKSDVQLHEAGLALEQDIQRLEKTYEESEGCKELKEVLQKKYTMDAHEYYHQIDDMLAKWEEEYNTMVKLT